MFRWIANWFSPAPTATDLTDSVPAGVRVRRVADALEGTLSGFVTVREQTVARVVFCGHRSTWVDLVPLGELEVA